MPVQRKVFRIEQMGSLATPSATVDRARHPSSQCDDSEVRQLKSDTDAIQLALNRTKREMIALHVDTFGLPPARVTRELDAVVESAERATQQILNAAEDIEEAAKTLSAGLKHQQELSLALDIQDNVLRVFEACNFQDLSGQRIAKVLATLKFVEERVAHMVAIWGSEACKGDGERPVAQHDRGATLGMGPGSKAIRVTPRRRTSTLCSRSVERLEYDPEKWEPVFGQDHAQTRSWSATLI